MVCLLHLVQGEGPIMIFCWKSAAFVEPLLQEILLVLLVNKAKVWKLPNLSKILELKMGL